MKENIENLKNNISTQKDISNELSNLYEQLKKVKTSEEKDMINSQIENLKKKLGETSQNSLQSIAKTNLAKPLTNSNEKKPANLEVPKEVKIKRDPKQEKILADLEKETLKRLKKRKEKKVEKKQTKPNSYVKFANSLFAKNSRNLLKKGRFKSIEKGIIRAKLKIIPPSYLSILFLTTILSVLGAFFIYLFFLFFSIQAGIPPLVRVTENIGLRALHLLWLIVLIPLTTFIMMYIYPSLEEKSAEMKINQELTFATIHMSAISGSMIDPTKVFEILISTKEYPYLEKEFTRLLNEITIYGYDLVTSLKNISANSPSKKLSDLLNGLSTTISSGGDLPDFFEKRAETLLFDYRIGKEKETKSAETFMDIYISVVIAAPMILMLLLIMMKISGLGLSLSTGTITLMTVLGVFLINIVFLTFLHVKQPLE